MQTNELRLFVSSTFRDLMPEREVLVEKIFPKVRELCRQRGAYFTEIDLRWGITAEEARTGKVVRICLEEIDKCRPHFIGIMGSRYGWQPDEEVLANDHDLAQDFPWLPELIAQGKSITEIEFLHGALHPKNTQSAFIYSRHNTGDQIEEGEAQLVKVRESVREVGVPLRTFLSPDELGELVLADLTAIIERDFTLNTEPDALTLMRQPHDAFSVNRRRSYVANPEYVTLFEEFVRGEGSPLVFTARSGLGKSSLMAYLTYEYKNTHDAFVVTHFVGASAAASGANDIIRHVMTEIKDRYSLTDEIPTEDSRLREEFPLWLAKVQSEKLVLAIDALNQLPLVDNELGWLPEFIPPNVRLVLSTTEGISYDNLHKRSWQEVEVKPLDVAMRRNIAVSFLARYHKTLTDKQFTMIANHATCESPLFLRTVLEELRVFGVYEEYETHLVTCLLSADERELFQHVLSRLEGIYGMESVRSVMCAIWAARYGLTETELLEITSRTRLDLSLLIAGLEYHLMQPSGLYTFFHQYLRDAVRERYIADEQAEREAHAHIARYFADTPQSIRRRDEEPWQWMKAEDWDEYQTCLTDIPVISELLEEGQEHELLAYWLEFKKHFDLDTSYRNAFEQYEAQETDRSRFAEISGKLGGALITSSHYKEAEHHIRKALEIRTKLYGEDVAETAESMNELARLYYYQGKYEDASKLFLQIVKIRERVSGSDDLKTIKTLSDLGVAYLQLARFKDAEEIYNEAIERLKIYYRSDHPEIATYLNNLGTSQKYENKIDQAIKTFYDSIQMCERLYAGGVCTVILNPMGNLALCLQEKKQYAEAEEKYIEALSLSRKIYGEYHNDVGFRLSNLGTFYSIIGRFEDAIAMNRNAIQVREHVLGEMHNLTVLTYLNLGITYARMGNKAESKMIFYKYFPIEKEMLGDDHPTVRKHYELYHSFLEDLASHPV